MGPKARRMVEEALHNNDVAVSAISFWEIGMQIQRNRLALNLDLRAWRSELLDKGIVEIPVNGDIGGHAGLLSDLHGDPADRIIVATALRGYRLITADRLILAWPGSISRLDASR